MLTYDINGELEAALTIALAATGGLDKPGKAPKGWVEREAARLMKQVEADRILRFLLFEFRLSLHRTYATGVCVCVCLWYCHFSVF